MKLSRINGCAAMAAAITSAALVAQVAPATAAITFSTFVTSAQIGAVEGQTNTIGFNFAGNKFVGSVYFGSNNLQLYSTNLTGGNVQLFGSPLPDGGGEPVHRVVGNIETLERVA
jgi:opacity protein-like surface antigen